MEAAGAVLGPICNLLFGCVNSKMTTALNLPSNLDVLVTQMKSLVDRRVGVKNEKEEAEKEGQEIRAEVVTWLEDVEKLELKVNPIQEEMVNNKKPSACFLNCNKRYKASKEVEEILEEIKRLLQAGSFDSGVAYTTRRPREVEHIPGPSMSQTTASKTLDKTMSLLFADRYRTIGIWGLGGVGKTTLVRTLNNQLNTTSTQPFGIVIWVTVSKNLDIKNVQAQIAQRLNLISEESVQRMAIRLHQRLEKEKKFLLILDDVWEKVDLNTLGVPQPEVHKGCKIILTSRRMEVCRKMMTDVEVKMEVLNDEEAWQLFCEKAGDVVHLEEIKPLAEAVVRECCRLPLAIITVGAAMRRKTKVELWDDTLKQLGRSVPSIEGIEAEVYKPLKWSYDSLQGNNIKSCFLYCSLFPEDFSIEIRELVQYWLAEGLIDEQQYYLDSINRGIALIENLKDSCLLEDGAREGTVKMHDVVRDVAIWIASSSEDGSKSLVLSGIGLSEISVGEFLNSNSLKRVSFMNNKVTRLPDCVIKCSKASTLLLQGNRALEIVPDRFLQGFEALRVLNLSGTYIRSLPLSLLQLGDLCALLLSNCVYLEELPPLGGLSRLQVLDLSLSGIRKLSRGMENLCNLRQLDLSHTRNLKTIEAGILSSLSNLEVLDMAESACYLILKEEGEEEEGRTTFEELRYLDRLLSVSIRLNRVPHLTPEDLSWITRLRGFQFFIGPESCISTRITTINDKRVIIRRDSLNFLQESIRQLMDIAKSLVFDDRRGLYEILKELFNVRGFACLKSLTITGSSMGLQTFTRLDGDYDRLPNLEELGLYRVDGLESISYLVKILGLRFLRLKSIQVGGCSGMKCLLEFADNKLTLPNLEVIKVDTCHNLETLFTYHNVETLIRLFVYNKRNMASNSIVPNLRTLELGNLPNLTRTLQIENLHQTLEFERTLEFGKFPDSTTLREYLTWPCIEQIGVFRCNSLRRLPLTKQNAGTIKEIKGDSEWWDALEWNDGETKSTLLPYFRPTLPKSLGFGGGDLNNGVGTMWPL